MTVRAFLQDHIKALSEHFDVYLVGNFTADNILSFGNLNLSGVESIPINRSITLFRDIVSVFKLMRYLRGGNFFATHSLTPKAGLVCAFASFLVRTPNRIHTFTGQVWHTQKGMFKHLLMTLDKIISSLNTHILVDGESQRGFLVKNNIVSEKKSLVLGYGSIAGVNHERFSPSPMVRQSIRQELGLDKKVVFGFMGRLNKDKGLVDLFGAFNHLVAIMPGAHLLIVGPDEANIISWLNRYPNINKSNTTYLGPTSTPEITMQSFDVFCLPSYREGFGTSVLEASCLGLPVICSDTYGLMDAMIPEETGLRHSVGGVNDLSEKMLTLGKSAELRGKMGTKGRAWAIENFSGFQITKEWVSFYKNLL